MSVDWRWKSVRGYIHYYDNRNKKHFVLGMYGGNCTCAIIYRYREKNKETGKIEKYYNFISFINDIEHLKRMLKSDKDMYRNLLIGKPTFRKFELYVTSDNKWANKEMLQVAKILAEYGYKVELK